MEKSISIVVPAYNEEQLILPTLEAILQGCKALPFPYEVIVVNDASTDRTKELVESFIPEHPAIRLVDNPTNLGFGGAYRQGVFASAMNYVTLICGDNNVVPESLTEVLSQIGKADLLVTYVTNPGHRNLGRRLLSRTFVNIVNYTFGLRIRYYNGHNVFPTRPLQSMEFTTGFFFSAQVIIRLVKSGLSFIEVPMQVKDREEGESKALSLSSFRSVISAYLQLIGEVYFRRRTLSLTGLKSV